MVVSLYASEISGRATTSASSAWRAAMTSCSRQTNCAWRDWRCHALANSPSSSRCAGL